MMSRRWPFALLALAGLILAALPLTAQNPRGSVRAPRTSAHRIGSTGQVFIPGFGFQPIIREGYPVFGLGFDSHHHFILNQNRGFRTGFYGGFGSGFYGGFRNLNSFGFFSVPFVYPGTTSSTTTVVVLPQTVPVGVPVNAGRVITLEEGELAEPVVATGLPDNWADQVRAAAPNSTEEEQPLPKLTLLVLKDETIIPATDYWREDERVFYVTSTGRQYSFPLDALDWEMSTQLNAERNIDFVLRSPE
jgi:hypothetical protein